MHTAISSEYPSNHRREVVGGESSGILLITSRRKTVDIGGSRKKTFAAIAKSLLKGHVQSLGGEKVCLVKVCAATDLSRSGFGKPFLPCAGYSPPRGTPCKTIGADSVF